MPQDEYDDEGASPPQHYQDDENASIRSTDSAVLIANSEASGEERFPPQSSHYISQYIPPRLQQTWHSIVTWVKGPQPPRPWKIHPYFPKIQTAPIEFINKFFPKRKHKIMLLVAFYFCWILSFVLVLHRSAFAADVPGYGAPVRIGCTDRLWNDGNSCGLNGDLCRPFANITMPFRCPATCRRVIIQNPHTVGDQTVVYKQVVVGGPTDAHQSLNSTIYRGDSFICQAAIHAGFISDTNGGCGVVAQIGEQSGYPSVNKNHIKSTGFDSYFPKSFTFIPGTQAQCRDLRWPLLGVSLTFTILLSLFVTSPSVFFVSEFLGIFFHVALVSDPPNLSNYYALISMAIGRLLPAGFCMYAVYFFAVKHSLLGLDAQIEKTILWLGGCWIGALNNYTFDHIPIERLTPHDIQNQPGAIPALITVVLVLFSIALGQVWAFRVEGRLPKYLAIYGILVGGVLALVAIPNMNVRIHHYILALLLVTGTAIQNRPSLLWQGILIGLFINGAARWGFASILETPDALRGDAPVGSLLPLITAPIIHNNLNLHNLKANITFDFHLPFPESYDGISILVNDVERYHEFDDRMERSWTWVKHMEGVPEYFRFAYLKSGGRGDYTKAGIWGADGSWTDMASGPSG
ncbi:hypothetical protein HBI24_217030 [Parastagonospora nodorum]|nr:hypothetical protein HBH51_214240 [Parastagonospora nodorum]KAH4155412.1 hypothetical protein HBH43_212100 [Parastagonospora nodorum]KAH4285787.1 hypothetical protein HBI02_226050 [Parastagonospora nodorum]KAH4287580.1 hypothetical protein HBI01_228280 [Parastagonospora nodorum]KAH4320475.1 hypothetical protein HBI00_226100 [Parastagonospora nodorum]